MSLSTYYLEYGRHLALLRRCRRRRRRRRRAYAHTSNTSNHDNHEKIHWWVSLDFHIRDAYGVPSGGPSGRRSSAITRLTDSTICKEPQVDRFISDHASVTCHVLASRPSKARRKITYRKLNSVDTDKLRRDVAASVLTLSVQYCACWSRRSAGRWNW